MNFIRHFLSNDSVFGRLMNRCGVLIISNLLFILCSLPIVTAGAGFTAMYYTMLKTLRGGGLNNRVLRTFWTGLKQNFKQATIAWIIMLALGVFLALELFWCSQMTGVLSLMRYGIMALLVVLVIIALYLFPVMAAFNGTLKELVVDSVYFAFTSPVNLVLILFANFFPLFLTYANLELLPLSAFLWAMFGFGAVAMFCSSRLLPKFRPHLDAVDICGDVIDEDSVGDPNLITHEESEEHTLDEMRKFGI